MSELRVLRALPESPWGTRPEDRSLEQRLRWGVFIADKPQGPTSHQVSAWVRDMAGAARAGHGGTLDPRVTGVLAVALNEATRALDALLAGDKEYVAVLQLHQDVDRARVEAMMARFVGSIYQMPPVRSAVKRELRARAVYEFALLEFEGRFALVRVRCESGTYIRTLAVDLGDALGVGAHLLELRRTRTGPFTERDARPLVALRDTFEVWRAEGREEPLRALLLPMERLLEPLPKIVVKDTAVDAICHGADVHVPGVAMLSPDLRRGQVAAVLTGKGEGVALATAKLTAEEIATAKSGVAADTKRVLMEPGTYPRLWRQRPGVGVRQ